MPVVTLVLSGGPGFPEGSTEHRYEVEVAVDHAGMLDPAAWREDPAPWRARRFRPGEPPRDGTVQSDAETGWSLVFPSAEESGSELAEPIVSAGVVRPGEYMTLRGADGRDFPYRIVDVA